MPGYINFEKIREQSQLVAPTESTSKRVKVAISEDIDSKSAAKAGNARTLRSEKDIKNSETNPLSAPEQDHSEEKGVQDRGNLFKTWLGDALTLFMFDNAPILMRLSFELREMLSKSQTVEAQSQMESAQASAQAKKEQGQSDAKKCTLDAQSQIANAVGSGLQGGLGFKDELLHSNAYETELANHDAIHSDLHTGKATLSNATIEGGDAINPQTGARLTEEELAAKKALEDKTIADLAKRYHAEYHQALEEEQTKIAESKVHAARSKLAERYVGLGKNADMIKEEQYLVASEKAGKTAFEKVLKEADADLIKKITSDPKAAEIFMKNLGNTTEEALGAIRGMNRNFRTQMLRSHGQAEGSSTFKAEVAKLRESVAHKASMAKSLLENAFQKRQILVQILNSTASSSTGLASADQIVKSAIKDAVSKGQDAISAVMQAARGAQDGTIQGALSQIQALLDWYSQMESQVVGAVSQSMA